MSDLQTDMAVQAIRKIRDFRRALLREAARQDALDAEFDAELAHEPRPEQNQARKQHRPVPVDENT